MDNVDRSVKYIILCADDVRVSKPGSGYCCVRVYDSGANLKPPQLAFPNYDFKNFFPKQSTNAEIHIQMSNNIMYNIILTKAKFSYFFFQIKSIVNNFYLIRIYIIY